MENFSKSSLGLLRNDIDLALKEISKKHGIDLSIGNISYNDFSARTTLNMTKSINSRKGDDDGKTKISEIEKANLKFLGLPLDSYDKVFNINGTQYKLKELKLNRPKNPCLIERIKDSKLFKCPTSFLK